MKLQIINPCNLPGNGRFSSFTMYLLNFSKQEACDVEKSLPQT